MSNLIVDIEVTGRLPSVSVLKEHKASVVRRGREGMVVVLLLLTSCATIETDHGQPKLDVITVAAAEVLADVSHRPIGINLNYLVDDDVYLEPAVRIAGALERMSVRYLRYPGGEKSDSYLWTVPPWPDSPSDSLRPMLARTGPGEWPADSQFTYADMATLIPSVLDFNEFMSVCQAVSCEPVIVVAADSPYVPVATVGAKPTREQLLESASEWVRYANITMRYGVKYWMIGNETWNVGYNGGTDAATYANDLIAFSRAMKAVDPMIKIIANGKGNDWWETVLKTASAHIDYLGLSSYPVTGWRSYADYREYDIKFDREVRATITAIEKYASPSDKDRLRIIVTETNAINFNQNGWPNRNDMGHALVLFQIFGDLLKHRKVAFVQCWGTRWIDVDSHQVPRVRDTIDRDGQLQATGIAIAVWGDYLLDTMVVAGSTKYVTAYATADIKTGQLNVFLANKDIRPRDVSIDIRGHDSATTADMRSLFGSGADDTRPTWQIDTIEIKRQRVRLTLPAVSITVIQIRSGASTMVTQAGNVMAFALYASKKL